MYDFLPRLGSGKCGIDCFGKHHKVWNQTDSQMQTCICSESQEGGGVGALCSKKFAKICQKVAKKSQKLPKSCQKVVKKLSKVAKKLPKVAKKVVKKLSKLSKKWQN
jgi:hypothetical protein